MPQINHPLLIGAAGLMAVGAGAAWAALRPSKRPGRTDRMRALVEAVVEADSGVRSQGVSLGPVEIKEGFGKPALVSFDLVLPSANPEGHAAAPVVSPLLEVLFDKVVHCLWDNPEIAPVAVRGRFVKAIALPGGSADREDSDREGLLVEVADMSELGFASEVARPEELYEHYGAPASDRTWRP